jgi:hypothetical protein
VAFSLLFAGTSFGLEKETSLVTGKKIGDLAVAGILNVDLHAEFMVSRTFEKDTVLNWYDCGRSGGKEYSQGGTFGNFGLDVPHTERAERYPHWAPVGKIPAVKFDGGDLLKGNFAVSDAAAGKEDMALEVWLHDKSPSKGEVILGWQSKDGKQTSAPLRYPRGMKGSAELRHIVVNCTPTTETWYLDGKKIGSVPRRMHIQKGHRMVLGGAAWGKPSFNGSLAAVRLHEKAMTAEEIAHNFKGGVMLGTNLHAWWRLEGPDTWWTKESKHFRHCVSKKKMKEEWNEGRHRDFQKRVPGMFELAEKLYHLYSERLAMRSSVVSRKPEYRGDGVKYNTPIQPSNGSWMGWSGKLGFGWGCQGAGHINPHELVHGWQAQTGGTMQGNYWEAHANFPQTYVGIYQTVPSACVSRVCMFFPANGRDYYHDRLMFEHLAQSPEYGPMFISKLWYDGKTEDGQNYPWQSFTKCDPDPSTPLAYEWMRNLQKRVTWDFKAFGGKPADLYRQDAERNKAEMLRYAHTLLEKIPYDKEWWRPQKAMTPQQLGYNMCPLKMTGGRVSAELAGYVSKERGGDWRIAFVGVNAAGKPQYGDVAGPGKTLSFTPAAGTKKLYLVVSAIPTKIMPIKMTGDFRSLEQEKFPYKLKLAGCEPLDVLAPEKAVGKRHRNGGGLVAPSARVDATAYVGPNARVLGSAKVLGKARVEDYAVVDGATVRDNAVVSGHALVTGGAIVQDHAKVRDYGRVHEGATIKDHAKVLEYATQGRKTVGGYAVIKGVAWSRGNVRGTAMVDGSYAKHNEIDKGKWFTWSWGSGKNAGEEDKEFGGIYMRMLFEKPHDWMARDDFAATWGYLVGAPRVADGHLVLNGRDQFVELQKDVADMGDMTLKAKVVWQGKSDERIVEFANDKGDAVWLTPSSARKCVFGIRKGGTSQTVAGPALIRGKPTEVMVVLSQDAGMLYIDGKEAARNKAMTLDPDDVNATHCYLGRGLKGNFFTGKIDSLEIYSVPTKDEVPPTPDPAAFAMKPMFANPGTVIMQAQEGSDPLGNVEYFFEETSGNAGGDDSGWIKTPAYRDTGLQKGKTYAYRVKMRDTSGNTTKPSKAASAKWKETPAFRSSDGKTIVVEAEGYTRKVAGAGDGRGIEWKLATNRAGYSGKGLMAALPDRGVQITPGLESQCPRLDYLIHFPAKGRYTVWMRSFGAHPGSDSVHYGLDMQCPDRMKNYHIGNGRFQWTRKADWIFQVDKPGMHTLNVWMREDGSAFDKLVITSDLGLKQPEGKGPKQSARK